MRWADHTEWFTTIADLTRFISAGRINPTVPTRMVIRSLTIRTSITLTVILSPTIPTPTGITRIATLSRTLRTGTRTRGPTLLTFIEPGLGKEEYASAFASGNPSRLFSIPRDPIGSAPGHADSGGRLTTRPRCCA